MNTSTMTIGKKLTAGFAVLGLMVAFIGGFALVQFGNMNDVAIRFTDSILPAVNRTSAIGDSLGELRRYELGYFVVDVTSGLENKQKLEDYVCSEIYPFHNDQQTYVFD